MPDTLAGGIVDGRDHPTAVDADRVKEDVRGLLLGGRRERKTCAGCGIAHAVEDWVVELTVTDDLVSSVGRCPACDRRDAHRVVDWLPRR